MKIQYAKFISLILPNSDYPIMPMDTAGVKKHLEYHYSPDVTIVNFKNIGDIITPLNDDHSYNIMAFSCSDEFYLTNPDILNDCVNMGLSAWGGKCITPEEALSFAQKFQPSREGIILNKTAGVFPLGEPNLLQRVKYGEVYLGENQVLMREIMLDLAAKQ